MLTEIAEGVLVRTSSFCQSNTIVVQGHGGSLVIDAGVLTDELTDLAYELCRRDQNPVVGFSTHPHWDHLLWHRDLGEVPRYATASCADFAHEHLAEAAQKAEMAFDFIPPDIVEQVPLDHLNQIRGLPSDVKQVPWDGSPVQVFEHRAHAPGHAMLLIADRRLLIAGDMLSDLLIPMPDRAAVDPLADYLETLASLDELAAAVDVFVPGHGTVGDVDEMHVRIEQDRAYISALAGRGDLADPRLKLEELNHIHEGQRQHFAQRTTTPSGSD